MKSVMAKGKDRRISRRECVKYGIAAATAAALGAAAYFQSSKPTVSQHTEEATWSTCPALPFGIADAPAATYGNSFFLFGGYGRNLQDCKNSVLEFNRYVWSSRSSMLLPRWGAAATVYSDNVYVFGGYPNSIVECYQIESDKWKLLGPMPLPLQGQGLMAATVGSKIYLFFANLTYEYDPEEDQYTRKTEAPIARTWATCAVVKVKSEDRIYIIGGNDLSRGEGTNVNYYYMPSSDSWSEPQPSAPYNAYGVTRDNPVWKNMIYYGFGHKNQPNQFFKAMYAYDPTIAKWSRLPTASHERDGVACAITGGVLYVTGGRNESSDQYGLTYCEALAL